MTDQPTHGGKRTGAGRKPTHGVATVCRSFSLTPDVIEYLATIGSASGQLEATVRTSRGFRKWMKERPPA